MDNVVRLEDVPEFIEEVIAKVRDGVALARKTGVLSEMPKEVQFTMTVVKEWQKLPVTSQDASTSEGISSKSDTGTRTQTSAETASSSDSKQDFSRSAGTTASTSYDQ